MPLFSWRCFRASLRNHGFSRAAVGGAFLAVGALGPRAARAQESELRVFIGFENQRADLSLTNRSALDGFAVSIERVVPPHGALVLDVRTSARSGSFVGVCEALPTPPCVPPTGHALDDQFLVLPGIRASAIIPGGRVFADALGGIGYMGVSATGNAFAMNTVPGWSPAAEAGAGFDAPLMSHVDARVRASMLFTNFDDAYWNGWRHHLGLSAGFVLKPGTSADRR